MVFIPTDEGIWVSEEFSRLAELIKDYDSYLELRWIPPDKRTREDKKPYVVIDTRINQPVLYASEEDPPVGILSKIYGADEKNGNTLQNLDLHNTAVRAMEIKKNMDELEDAHDRAKFFLRSPFNYMKMNGKKYDDQRRVIDDSRRYII